jgi:hypothetical protein
MNIEKKYYCHKHISPFEIYQIFFKLFESQYSMNPKLPIYYTWYKESARVIYIVKHCILPPIKKRPTYVVSLDDVLKLLISPIHSFHEIPRIYLSETIGKGQFLHHLFGYNQGFCLLQI